jgi:hypothetical protein
MLQMIENPKTVADVKANFDEADRIKDYKGLGLSDGQAELAVQEEPQLRALNDPKTGDAPDQASRDARAAKFKAAGLSDGQADFAADLKIPGG